MPKVIILGSGGLDSLCCLIKAIVDHGKENILSVGFDYNQRHKLELGYAQKQCDFLGIKREVIDIPFLGALGGSQLTDMDQVLTEDISEQIKTVVPLRNQIMLTIAAAKAQVEGYSEIWTGPNKEDYTAYRDCRREFYDALEAAIQAGLTEPAVGSYDFTETLSQMVSEGETTLPVDKTDIKIITPYVFKYKRDILTDAIANCEKLGVDFNKVAGMSHTCYSGKRPACGKCNSCTERIVSFKQIGRIDPIEYATSIDW